MNVINVNSDSDNDEDYYADYDFKLDKTNQKDEA
jgi:hypothetical protein